MECAVDLVTRFFEGDRFAAHSGIELLEAGPGYARAQMAVQPWHLNGVGTVHGAALFALADLAFAVACNAHGTVAVAVNVNISYLKAVTEGTLTAEATEESKSHRLGLYTVRVTDGRGDLVALFEGMAYRKGTPLPGVEPADRER
jgi:acyl-CoA thioesterase